MRRLISIFLLMILPLQSLAMQGGWSSDGNVMDIAHEIDHSQGTSHHHGDDGSVHYDNSEESIEHASDHSCCQQTAALPNTDVAAPNIPVMLTKTSLIAAAIRDSFPERPQRPPSSLG